MPPSQPGNTPDQKRDVILIVDDDPAVAAAVIRAIRPLSRAHNLQIQTANSVQEALTKIGEFRDRLALVLSDCELCPGMGDEIILAAKENGVPKTAILTGGRQQAHVEEALSRARPDLILDKPFGSPNLRQVIANLLGINLDVKPVEPA